METGSFGIGLGLGLALGVVLGVTLMLVFKKADTNAGVMYTYDEENRLKSMVPTNENIQLVTLKAVK